jgi:hypothetical protein
VFVACIAPGAVFAGIAGVQLTPPLPRTIPGQQCSPEYQKILKLQADALRALQRLSRRDGERLCASLPTRAA